MICWKINCNKQNGSPNLMFGNLVRQTCIPTQVCCFLLLDLAFPSPVLIWRLLIQIIDMSTQNKKDQIHLLKLVKVIYDILMQSIVKYYTMSIWVNRLCIQSKLHIWPNGLIEIVLYSPDIWKNLTHDGVEQDGISCMISAPSPPTKKSGTSRWFQPPWKKSREIGSSPEVRVKIRYIWNHQPEKKTKTQYTADPLAAFPLPNAVATQFAAFAPGAQDCPDRTTLAALACNARPNVRDSRKLIGFEEGA